MKQVACVVKSKTTWIVHEKNLFIDQTVETYEASLVHAC